MEMSTFMDCHIYSHSCESCGLVMSCTLAPDMYSADFSPLNTMRKVGLWNCGEVILQKWTQICPQLTDKEIHYCQVSWADVSSQWLSLQRLDMSDCGKVRLSQLKKLCPNLKELTLGILGGGAVCVDGVAGQWKSLQTLWLWHSHLVQSGRRLTEKEAKQVLRDICPSASIHFNSYKVNRCTEFPLNTVTSLLVVSACLTHEHIIVYENRIYLQHIESHRKK